MKKLKKSIIFAAFSLILATAFTSCLDSDSDSDYFTPRVMTDTEANLYLAEISGTYSGDLMCSYEDVATGKTGVDTFKVDLTIGYDKTVTVDNMPDALFKRFIRSNSPVRAIAENATTTHSMSMNIGTFIIEEDNSGNTRDKAFYLDAKNATYDFDYTSIEDGEPVYYQTTVKFTDYITDPNNPYITYPSFGGYDKTTGTAFVWFVLESVKAEQSDVRNNALIVFSGKRR